MKQHGILTEMTKLVCAYDTELEPSESFPENVVGCLEACRSIVAVHLEYKVPATFFITGKLLERHGDEFRRLLNNDLFEVASHSYSHQIFIDHPICGLAVPLDDIWQEISLGKELVESVFQKPCHGFRPGCAFTNGFDGHPEILDMFDRSGFKYISSDAWGINYSLPAPLKPPRTYSSDGYPDLWELPACGWHENLLKGNNSIFGVPHASPEIVLNYPDDYPRPLPDVPVITVEDELRFNNRYYIQKSIDDGYPIVSLIWHPWSLHLFDPQMDMLRATFELVRGESALEYSTYYEAIPNDTT